MKSVRKAAWILAAVCPLVATAPAAAQGNVLIVDLDDIGVDKIAAYGLGSATLMPYTPNISELAAGGVLFQYAYTNPVCSPTRAAVQTGRYAFRNGVGSVVQEGQPAYRPLSVSEVTLAEMLGVGNPAYATSMIGKWHVDTAGGLGPCAPIQRGYDYFAGVLGNLDVAGYASFPKMVWSSQSGMCVAGRGAPLPVGCPAQTVPDYATTSTADEAIAWIDAQSGPWMCYVAFHAPHEAFHRPPAGLYVGEPVLNNQFPVDESPAPYYKAMVEAVDTELGRLLACIDPQVLAQTTVVLYGDNGTPGADRSQAVTYPLAFPPFDPDRAKGTVYEGGIRVPFLVSGPLVAQPGRVSQALVNSTDIFATVAEIAGVDLAAQGYGCGAGQVALDSISLVPLLTDPCHPGLRTYAFAEMFAPNFDSANPPAPVQASARAIRNGRYKLIRYEYDLTKSVYSTNDPIGFAPPCAMTMCEEFYDLFNDPREVQDLLQPGVNLLPDAQTNLSALRVELDQLLASCP